MRKRLPYSRQWIDEDDITSVVAVLKSDLITQGPAIVKFEERLAHFCNVKYAVAVNNGTAALHLAYLAAGLTRGDEVITTPNTFVATSNMLLVLGVKPVFCDIRLDTYNINEKKIERLITKRTKAIVPVHFAGQPCEMNEILRIAKKHKLLVIEDAAHALGAVYKGKKIGSLGDITMFSFHPVKTITTGEGGALVTNSKQLYEKMKLLRNHGMYKDKQGKNVMVKLGYNYRMTDIQAALGISQLKKVHLFLKRRRQIVAWYEQAFRGMPEVVVPREIAGNSSAWHLYVIRVPKEKRDDLVVYLNANDIGANFHYPAVYSHPYYQRIGYADFTLPNEEEYYHSCACIPCFPQLTRSEVFSVASLIRKYFA